jgi:hypothetical protein
MDIKHLSSRGAEHGRAVPHALGNIAIREFYHGMRSCTSLAKARRSAADPLE